MKYTTRTFINELKASVEARSLENVVNIISNFHYNNISPPNLSKCDLDGEFYGLHNQYSSKSEKQCYELDDIFFSSLNEINQLITFLIQLDSDQFESLLLQSFLEKLNSLNKSDQVYIRNKLYEKYPNSDLAYSLAATNYLGSFTEAYSALKLNPNLANHIILFKNLIRHIQMYRVEPIKTIYRIEDEPFAEELTKIANSIHLNRAFMISHLIIASCIPLRAYVADQYENTKRRIIESYNNSLKIEKSCYAYIMKLKVLEGLKDYDSIISTSKEALYSYKNVYILYNYIAMGYYETQNYEESIDWCNKIEQNVKWNDYFDWRLRKTPYYFHWSIKKVREIAYDSLKCGDYEKSLMYYQKYCPINESVDLKNYCKAILLSHNINSFSTVDIIINKLKKNNKHKFKKYFGYSNLNFGKNKGKNLDSLIIEDAQYISWCVINLDHFYISFELFFNENMKKLDNYYKALKVNILKSEIDAGENGIVIVDYEYEENSSDYYDCEGDWGGLYGEEAFIGYWNTE